MFPWCGVCISQPLMTASTDLPPIHGGTYDLAAHRILPQTHTHTLQSLKAQKTLALQRGHRSTVAAERNRWSLVEGENHS